MKRPNTHIGSPLEDFLKEESILEEARAVANEAIAFEVQTTMQEEGISKVEMARRMNIGRAALDRFLAPGSASVTHHMLARAARAIGRDLPTELA